MKGSDRNNYRIWWIHPESDSGGFDYFHAIDGYRMCKEPCQEVVLIEQSIGVCDKRNTGTEIYEGDLLDICQEEFPGEHSIYQVIFEDGCFRKKYISWNEILPKPILTKYALSLCNDTIIGNIHENLEKFI